MIIVQYAIVYTIRKVTYICHLLAPAPVLKVGVRIGIYILAIVIVYKMVKDIVDQVLVYLSMAM